MKFIQRKSLAFVLISAFALTSCGVGPTLETAGHKYENKEDKKDEKDKKDKKDKKPKKAKKDDVYIVFRGFVFEKATAILPVKLVGEIAYDLQEGAREDITDISGVELDYYYIWVCLEDACIPIDPFRYSG